MANQPPAGRPWLLRLASQARLEPQIQAPPPQPALPPRGPPIRQASLALGRSPLLASDPPPPPTQPRALPQTALPAQPTSPQPVAPPTPQRPPSPRPVATSAARSPTPPQSPKVIQTPSPTPSSPSRMTSTRPPSSTPVPHPEPELKRTVEQENAKKSGANGSSNGVVEAQKNSRSSNHSDSSKHSAQPTDMKAFPSPSPLEKKDIRKMRAVTIAGHNIGAFMDLGSPYSYQSRRQQVHYAKNEPQVEDVKNTEGKTYAEEKVTKAATKQQPMLSLVNSNVQSVNNSLLFNTSCAHGSPGVHINIASNGHKNPSSPH
ncbi:hypothetical protein C4D60_Mb11t08780 [Musa balbisiana]|uniref:Uncharacterized protein n=1 Tax=Musa balbisiana TaxID=52838 RepID=A0A4S8J2Q2_MUSBA|nr:hypothetical protein C4D60_Mb11t08780 [Musa balbisiana]